MKGWRTERLYHIVDWLCLRNGNPILKVVWNSPKELRAVCFSGFGINDNIIWSERIWSKTVAGRTLFQGLNYSSRWGTLCASSFVLDVEKIREYITLSCYGRRRKALSRWTFFDIFHIFLSVQYTKFEATMVPIDRPFSSFTQLQSSKIMELRTTKIKYYVECYVVQIIRLDTR